MKTNYITIKAYLEKEPRARERKNKNRCIGNVILEQYNIIVEKSMMADIVGEILNYDRVWRKVLEDEPRLRGSDYNNKVELEKKVMESLYG